MFLRCANPHCSSQFDYREGQLIRAPKQAQREKLSATAEVEHFWLCGKCATQYFLEYRQDKGVALSPRPLGPVERAAKNAAAA
ncbi:MAG: hypothetical protein ACRD5K_00685 [Candidatus Acidiferrales bacterium]